MPPQKVGNSVTMCENTQENQLTTVKNTVHPIYMRQNNQIPETELENICKALREGLKGEGFMT